MDSFINLARQFDSGGNNDSVTKTGGEEYNAPHHRSGGSNPPWFNEDEVVQRASEHGSGDPSLFSSALNHVNSNKNQHDEPLDEDRVIESHDQAYNRGSGGNLDASSMGSAAAMQIMKKFTGGGGGSGKPQSQTDLISLAMAEASKLFDKSGGAASGNKQDAVNSAGMTIMKLLVQSKFSGTVGGGNSGGLGGLMSMAGKFM